MADKAKPAEQTTPEYDEWVASRAAAQEDEDSGSGETQESEDDRIDRAVQAALLKERERVAAAAPQSAVPNHAGGVGVDDHQPTWSQYDQEQAYLGIHPLQQ